MAKTADRVTAGDMQDLAIATEQLHEEVRLLRTALDELRDDVVWAARNVLSTGFAATSPPTPLVPRDPLAPDAMPHPSAAAGTGGTLGSEASEAESYCCDRPKLVWVGDAESPGIECANCGYLVAQSGEVVIWRDAASEPSDDAESSAPSVPQQKSLFSTD